MADVKVSGLPSDSSLDASHYTIINDPTGPTTKRTLLSTLASFFFNQANIPAGSGSPVTRFDEALADFIVSGLVWTGDAYASTRVASMTSGTVYINGRRFLISAVVSRTFTASKDTYIDVLDNLDGTCTIVYTEVTNNAASPALASNSIRIGIIITGASNIASVASINQGQESKLLPIASSIPYQVSDSLGNLISNKTSSGNLLGLRRRTSAFSTASTSFVDITELQIPFILATERKIKFSLEGAAINVNGSAGNIWNIGLDVDGTMIMQWYRNQDVSALNMPLTIGFTKTFAAGSHTAKFRISVSGGTVSVAGGTDNPGTGAFTPGPLAASVELR